jgi:hypothetical protein
VYEDQASDPNPTEPLHRHESNHVDLRVIFAFCLALVLLGLVVHFTVGGLMTSLSGQAARSSGATRGPSNILRQSSAPHLQDDPAAELAKLRTDEDLKLNSYGWVDREAGVVRIPIERAMDLLLKKGLPARSARAEENQEKKD